MNAETPSESAAPAAASKNGAAGNGPPGRARQRRPELARTEPLRGAGTLLRDTAPRATASAGIADAAGAAEDAVARGVRLGYQVIEQQILQGQKLAQRLGRAAARVASPRSAPGPGVAGDAPAAGATGDAEALLDRVVHLYRDVGALCVDALEAVARNPVLRAGMARMTPDPGAAAAPARAAAGADAAPGGSGPNGFAVEISCSRRTRVTLDLRAQASQPAPRVHALHALDPALPSMTGVQFSDDAGPKGRVLRITIDDDQPAGTYTGVVADGATNEPCGTLSVRVL